MRAVLLGTGSPRPSPTRGGPADIGQVARAAVAKKLVISHLIPGSVPAELEAAARRALAGAITVGEDLAEV